MIFPHQRIIYHYICVAGYGVSMLMHLAEGFPDSVAKLTMQYRMHEDICHLSNKIGKYNIIS